jgi:DNA invertase Pin-like site-specific DNA recombinase
VLLYNGKSWREIEDELDICHTHLYRIIKEYGWYDGKYNNNVISRERAEYRTLTPDKIEDAKRLRGEGKTWEEVADLLGVDRTTLYRHGVPKQFKPLRGQLTEEKRKVAIDMRRNGKKWKEIAAELEISPSAIFMSKLNQECEKQCLVKSLLSGTAAVMTIY